MGDPCNGDTVAFAVLHINGSLSGFEDIEWYKNDTLLPLMTDEDTLFITEEGQYECKVINPQSDCPNDTTAYSIEYDCAATGVSSNNPEKFYWSMFPNPVTETMFIKFKNSVGKKQVEIYDVTGQLVKTFTTAGMSEINVSDLPQGLYYVRLKNNSWSTLKFIKQ
jgi:hypothetical protein